jgi:hypothetical protein
LASFFLWPRLFDVIMASRHGVFGRESLHCWAGTSHRDLCTTVGSGRSLLREADLYECTASIAEAEFGRAVSCAEVSTVNFAIHRLFWWMANDVVRGFVQATFSFCNYCCAYSWLTCCNTGRTLRIMKSHFLWRFHAAHHMFPFWRDE